MGHDLAPGLEQARQLTDVDLPAALELCAADPVGSVLAYCRLLTAVESGVAASGGQVWGFPAEGPLEAVCWAGANLVPVLPPWLVPRRRDEASAAFAAFARSRGRRSSSIVGRADGVLGLWRHLDGAWGPAREIRPEQPSLVIAAAPAVEPDPEVRASMPEQLGTLLPACVSMFVEEVGYSPLSASSSGYERRVLHTALQNHPAVTTHSEGEEPNRRVVIMLKNQPERPEKSAEKPQSDRPNNRRRSNRRRGPRKPVNQAENQPVNETQEIVAAPESPAVVDVLGVEE